MAVNLPADKITNARGQSGVWSEPDAEPVSDGLLALAGLHPGVLLVNDVNTPVTAHHPAILVTGLRRFEAVANFHG
jgi:hypothetical protein